MATLDVHKDPAKMVETLPERGQGSTVGLLWHRQQLVALVPL